MSETASTVIKLLSALTSPKASLKYLTVALFLFLSWYWFKDVIAETGIPIEQRSIIMLLIGVGLGSIVGHFLSMLIEYLWNLHLNKKIDAEKTKNDALIKESEKNKKIVNDQSFIEKFKNIYPHLYLEQRNLLRELCTGNKNVDMLDSMNSALKDNEYILIESNISSTSYNVCINPLIENIVVKEWDAEIKARIKEFYGEDSEDNMIILSLLLEENEEDDSPVSREILNGLSEYTGCIKGSFSIESVGYWIWFDDYMREKFEKRTKKDYLDELFIPESRVE